MNINVLQSRRSFMTFSGKSIAGGLYPRWLAPLHHPTDDEGALRSEFLLDLTIEAEPAQIVGFPGGERAVVAVTGGSFQGPRLKGAIASGGAPTIAVRFSRSKRSRL